MIVQAKGDVQRAKPFLEEALKLSKRDDLMGIEEIAKGAMSGLERRLSAKEASQRMERHDASKNATVSSDTTQS